MESIVDAGLIAHVGTVRDGLPVVIPMFCVRDGDSLLLHGAPASGVIRRGKTGADVCVTMTILDGLVLARSAFHHSVNYRSVVVIGNAEEVTEADEKAAALDMFIEQLVPGRSGDLRPTNEAEFRGTSVLRVSLAEASTKVRTGGPIDDEPDYATAVWAGVVPLSSVFGPAIDDPRLNPGIPTPHNVAALEGKMI